MGAISANYTVLHESTRCHDKSVIIANKWTRLTIHDENVQAIGHRGVTHGLERLIIWKVSTPGIRVLGLIMKAKAQPAAATLKKSVTKVSGARSLSADGLGAGSLGLRKAALELVPHLGFAIGSPRTCTSHSRDGENLVGTRHWNEERETGPESGRRRKRRHLYGRRQSGGGAASL